MAEQGAELRDGAPDGGSPEGGQGKGDEKLIPEARLRAALADQERRLTAAFEERLAAATKPKADPPKRYSRTELNAAVAAGQITQDQSDEAWERQIREDARAEAANAAATVITEGQRKERVDTEIARYKALAPEILDDSHETRQKIRSAYQDLVSLGDDPRDVATQLKAIRQVLGPVDLLEQARKGKPSHDEHRETGGGGGGEKPRKRDGEPELTARQRAYYEPRVGANKLYPDWNAVKDELKYAAKRA